MLLTIRRLGVIVSLPVVAWGLALFFAPTLFLGIGADSFWTWAPLVGMVGVALVRTRIVRRAGERIVVTSVRGRAQLPVEDYLLHLETHVSGRFGGILWQLVCKKNPEKSVAMGSLLFGVRSGIRRAADVLAVPLSLETEVLLQGPEGTIADWRRPGWQYVAFGALVLAAVAFIVGATEGDKGELVVQCAANQEVRLGGGYGRAAGKRTVLMHPGSYQVDLWIPQRGCWARSGVMIAARKTTSIACADLELAGECVADEPRSRR